MGGIGIICILSGIFGAFYIKKINKKSLTYKSGEVLESNSNSSLFGSPLTIKFDDGSRKGALVSP